MGLGLANVGVIAAAHSQIKTPLTVIQSRPVQQWARADLGITLNGSNVAAWAEQSGNGHNYAAAGSTQPLYVASESTLGNRACIVADGVDDFLANATLTLPQPSADPTLVILIARQDVWTGGSRVFSAGGANDMLIYQSPSTPDLQQYNGAGGNVNSAATIGAWKMIAHYVSNTAADYLLIGSTNVATAPAGNTLPAIGVTLFAAGTTGALPSAVSIAEVVIATGGDLTSNEWIDIKDHFNDFYATAGLT